MLWRGAANYMEKEILRISNGYLLTMNQETVFYKDFASCIFNAFKNEYNDFLEDENKQLFIKSEIK